MHCKYIIALFFSVAGLTAGAQTINYVRSWDVQKPVTDASTITATSPLATAVMSTQYLDGIGRPVQTVSKGTSYTGKDMVMPVAYDVYGREVYKYLPYASGGTADGAYETSAIADQQTFYSDNNTASPIKGQGETYYYSQTDYEASPLNRVLKAFAPGNNWVGTRNTAGEKSVRIQYGTNTAAEGVRQWTIAIAAGSLPASTAAYATGKLTKTLTTDEAGHKLAEYKDGEGRVILKKVQIANTPGTDHTGWLCTYYIYDDLGNLRCVMQPRAVEISTTSVSQTTADEFCFRYEYDSRHRMIIKKVPGAGEVWMVYDARDRLVYMQDANLRTKNWWLATLYDALNRPVQTGMMTGYTGTRAALQTYVDPLTPGVSSTSVAGTGINPQGDNLSFAQREAGRTSYTATNSVTLADGFSSEDGANFTAEIASSATPSFSGTQATVAITPPSGSSFIPLTMTFYDEYSFTSKAYSTTNNSKLDIGINDNGDALPAAKSTLTKSLPTGSRVRVIENPDDLTQGKWMETVTFYDDKGRVIQTQSDNYKGGADVNTTRYAFNGSPVSSYSVHNNAPGGTANLRVKTNLNYDAGGRLLTIQKSLNDGTAKTIVTNTYDDLGQLKKKSIGANPAASGPLEVLDYDYNIRGWLLGMNRAFAKSTSSTYANYFGFDLGYDKTVIATPAAASYTTPQYNGNIEGTVWRSAGDGEVRKYDYTYDNANRLLTADFTQYTGTTFNTTAKVDFSVTNLSYDANGNILTLKQMGLKVGGSTPIDELTYTYAINSTGSATGSNRLQNVKDVNSDAQTVLGDFRYSAAYTTALGGTAKSNTTVDYGYDANGNLTSDKNKDITSITYNYLNLPSVVTVTGKGTITYIYDAVGSKLEKRTVDNTASPAATTTTTYLGGFVYRNNTLQFFGHEEGRIRKTVDGAGFVYDYFLKDHLGNVRMMLTEETKTDVYPTLDFEGAAGSGAVQNQDLVWDNASGGAVDVIGTRTARPANMGTSATNGSYGKLLRKSSATAPAIGAGKLLRVMSGDQINTSVDYYYPSATASHSYADGIGTLTTSLLSILMNTVGVSPAVKGATATVNTGLRADLSIATKITDPENNMTGSTQPKAYLHVLLFNEQFQFDNANSWVLQIELSKAGILGNLAKVVTVKKNGYAYIYFSNESNNDVYFDNFKLTHTRGQILQETHYSPWGLALAGISSQALGFGGNENKNLYNGKEEQSGEFSDGSGLEEYDYGARMYDAQLGIWHNIDPLAEKSRIFSPYNYGLNNPIRFIDPDGMESVDPGYTRADLELERSLSRDAIDWGKAYFQQLFQACNSNGGHISIYEDERYNKTLTVNMLNPIKYEGSDKYVTVLRIHNAFYEGVKDIDIDAPSYGPVGIKKVMDPVDITIPIDPGNLPDAYMISVGAAASGLVGTGYSVQAVFILKGNDQGVYFYGDDQPEGHTGFTVGIGAVGGKIDFNEESGKSLNRYTFEGDSQGYTLGYASATMTNVKSYVNGFCSSLPPSEAKCGPLLYSGYLFGLGKGPTAIKFGATIYESHSRLFNNLSIKF